MKRILHIVGGMNRGGVETWLMHVLRHLDRRQYQMDFLVSTTEPCAYDDEIRALGSQIIPCLYPSKPLTYARNLRAVLEAGKYDVVHSHVYLFSGVTLPVAYLQRVRTRIAHIYPTEDWKSRSTVSWSRHLYRKLMATSIMLCATHILFDSPQAKSVFSSIDGRESSKLRVLHCGIDLSPFRQDVDVASVRSELSIPSDAKVVLTVSRYVPHKNHRHLIEIARRVVEIRDDVYFVSVGDGPLYDEIEGLVRAQDLETRFRFVRSRPSIVSLYQSADLFLFPSLMEGFGLVVVEAAAAGLPIVASRIPGILESARSSPAPVLVDASDTEAFTNAVLQALDRPKSDYVPRPKLLEQFDVDTSRRELIEIYSK